MLKEETKGHIEPTYSSFKEACEATWIWFETKMFGVQDFIQKMGETGLKAIEQMARREPVRSVLKKISGSNVFSNVRATLDRIAGHT